MFLQAGINPHGRWLRIFAFTLPSDRSSGGPYRVTACEMHRFASGDTAWIPTHRRFIAWPHQVQFVDVSSYMLDVPYWRIPRLPWDERIVCLLETREERRVL